MATRQLCRVFKLNTFSKVGLKVTSSKNTEKKESGDEKLQTDDLLLDGSNTSFSKSDNTKKLDNKDSTVVEKGINAEQGKGVTNTTVLKLQETKPETKISEPPEAANKYVNIITNILPPSLSTKSVASDDKKDVKSEEDSKKVSPLSLSIGKVKKDDTPSASNESNKTINTQLFNATSFEVSKKVSSNESVDSLKIPNLSQLNNPSKQSLSGLETNESESEKKKKVNLKKSLASSSSDSERKAPTLSGEISSSKNEFSDVGYANQTTSSGTKIPVTDFDPNFVNVTPERKLPIGRLKDKKKENTPSYFLEKSDSEEAPTNETPKKADASRTHNYSVDDAVRKISSICKIPDLIATQKSNISNKPFDFNAIQSLINATKDGEKYGEKFNLSNLNKRKIQPRPFPIDTIDPLTIPGYKPSISERPILPKDFIKLTEPAAITSYDLVPGPPLLKAVSNAWKYVPLLGTQFVATILYSLQALISSCDRSVKYPYIYPYYYLLNKYGPMVRLHGPIGADILVMAVNGLDFPVVHIKTRANKRQSLFDCLNTYRRDATPLSSHMINVSQNSKSIPDNPTLLVAQHYDSLERITDDFLKRKKFTRSYTGMKENENHGSDLIRWAMQCTLDVYFKTKRDFLDNSESIKIVDLFTKVSKSVQLCETGIQLWRAFPTLTWLDLTDQCKEMDRYIFNEVSQCMSTTNLEKTNGSAVEVLLATDELRSTDLLTPLLDLLIININMAANLAGFLLYHLSKSPQTQRTLFREVTNVLPKKQNNIEQADLEKMKYLRACIIETLRMMPLIPFLSRQIEEDTRIRSFQIPKGTYIQMVNVLPCSRGDVIHDDVGRFQAERWFEKTTSLGGDPFLGLPHWESFPKFNKDLVLTQVALLVTKIVRQCRLEYPNTEVHADGTVLQGPTSPFNFAFIERVL